MNGDTGPNITRRYPVSFAIRYVTGLPAEERTVVGETLWMSRGEMAFMTKEAAFVGEQVVISIEWPVLLQGKVPLQLTVTAEIVERAGFMSVARLSKHEFRTRGLYSRSTDAQPSLPLPAWEAHPARKMPATNTLPHPRPVLASAAGG